MRKIEIIRNNILRVIIVLLLIAGSISLFTIGNESGVAKAFDNNEEKYYGDISYSDGYIGKSETETIEYATRTVTHSRVNVNFPNCYNSNSDLVGACANVAGANIINYYDRYFDDLIPDYVSGRIVRDFYMYYPMRTNISKKQAVIDTLYTYMKTSVNKPGTTQAMCKQGLAQYVNEKGRDISYSSVFTNKNIDINKFMTQIQNGHPVILYLSGFNMTTILNNENKDILSISLYDDLHIVVAYGYQIIDYYNQDGNLITSRVCLEISSGIRTAVSTGLDFLYIVGHYGVMDYAEAVNIY